VSRRIFIVGREGDPLTIARLESDSGEESPLRYEIAFPDRNGVVRARDDLSIVELRAIHAGIQAEMFLQGPELHKQAAYGRRQRDELRDRSTQREIPF
jgi:hypothetical protein